MTNPTTPFGWQMPTSTDLVTDLPADFETFGQAVATSMGDLLGGTTGQILAKNSNTDMDFVWIANDQGDITAVTASSPLTGGGTSGAITVGIQDGTTAQKGAVQLENSTSSTSTTTAAVPASVKSAYDLANGAIPKTLIDAAGDLIVGTAADTAGRLAIGTNGQVLQSNGTTAVWATPASTGALTLISTTSFTTASSVSTGSVFSSTYTNYKIFITITACSATNDLNIRLRTGGSDNSTAGNYLFQNFTTGGVNNSDAHSSSWSGASATSFAAGSVVSNAGFQNRFITMELLSPFETFKTGYSAEALSGNAGPYDYANKIIGRMDVTTSYDAFTIIPGSGTITGKVSVYGYSI
jgi:hypothetical protein